MDLATCNAVWALLGNSVTVTLQDVELLGEVMPRDALDYLEELIRMGYVRFAACKRLPSGEYEIAFRQVIRTGDYAPYLDDEGNFMDPNLPPSRQPSPSGRGGAVGATGGRAGEGRTPCAPTDNPRGEGNRLPTYSGRMRLAAEGMGHFTREELKAVMVGAGGYDSKSFKFAWKGLTGRGVFTPQEGGAYRYDPPEHQSTLRLFFRGRLGETFTASDIPTGGLTGPKAGNAIRAALDLLAAEGYQVTIARKRKWRRGAGVTYRVEEKRESSADYTDLL